MGGESQSPKGYIQALSVQGLGNDMTVRAEVES